MNIKKITMLFLCVGTLCSCTKDLDRVPKYALTTDGLYKNEAGYRSSLAKIYGGLALTGNSGPDGNADIGGIDESFSSYIRAYWQMQELPTDEAVMAWNNLTLKDFHEMDWTASDLFNGAMYSRIFYQITLANAFIKESAEGKLVERNIAGADAEKIRAYRAEARFLRALSYLHAIDLYGSTTFVTEADGIGVFQPRQVGRKELFTYIENECKDIESLLPAPRQNEYARADKAAVWMILANLYLNAKIYTGTDRNTEAINYSLKVINAGYILQPKYGDLFVADNHNSKEVIFPIAFDGMKTRTFGGTTYLVHAGVGGDMQINDFGIDFGWGGLRTTKALVNKFADISGTTDKRAMFQITGQTLEIADIGQFRDGYAIRKWKNVTSAGVQGSNSTWVDTDFPMFRLAEAYLIFAEAVLRGGSGGTPAEALNYINMLRTRAYGNTNGDLAVLTLDDVLDERARELHWEGKRRTDLIRYDRFTTASYLWPWKGNVAAGKAVEPFRNLFPIPSSEINANPNLIQNQGY